MPRLTALGLALLAVIFVAVTPPANAWRRGGDDRGAPTQAVSVSSEQAVAIARARGLVRLHEVKFDRGRWEVEGWDAQGRKVEFDIHPTSGDVLKHEVYGAR
jgi:uncharacterized membrane protein YkoI